MMVFLHKAENAQIGTLQTVLIAKLSYLQVKTGPGNRLLMTAPGTPCLTRVC